MSTMLMPVLIAKCFADVKDAYTMDFGEKGITIRTWRYGKNVSVERVSGTDLSTMLSILKKLPLGAALIVEDAHLGTPRSGRKLSLAQYYEAEELIIIYRTAEELGIHLLLISQVVTPKGRAMMRIESDKSDEIDTMAIGEYLNNVPNAFQCLKKPRYNFDYSPKDLSYFKIKKDIDEELNFMRTFKYQHESDNCSEFVENNLLEIARQMTPEARSFFNVHLDAIESNWDVSINKGFRYNKRSKLREGQIHDKYWPDRPFFSLMSIWLTIDGKPRIHPHTKRLPGMDNVFQYLIATKPFHFKGGVARSNMYHHKFHHVIATEVGKVGGYAKKRYLYTDDDWNTHQVTMKKCKVEMRSTLQAMKRVVVSKFNLDY